MTFVVPITRREAVLRRLRDDIVSGALPQGSVLKDAELAARLGVSITPVREAITQLAAEGLIDIAPNRTRRVTRVTQKNALELNDVMGLLACAGFEWGVHHLTPTHLAQLHRRFDEFVAALGTGNVSAAGGSGADFSTIVISASGNRELQTHVDLVVARTLRLLALAPDSALWTIWIDGYRETLALLDADDRPGAVARYRLIYVHVRALLQTMEFSISRP